MHIVSLAPAFRRMLRALLLLASLPAALLQAKADTVLVPAGATWKYLDNGTDQGSAWRAPGFADAGWASGPAELGYGDGGEATLLNYGPNSSAKFITTYFRHSFTVADASAFATLRLRVVRDDGVVIYLNGQEIWRNTMPTGTITASTLATAAIGGTDESAFVETTVPSTHLLTGQNVIAAEIHQANGTSSDISFNLELIGRPAGLVRQPYLQLGTPNSVVIRWRTDIATDSVVRFGPSATDLSSSITANATTPTTEHEVTLTGLTPDTRYYYSVGSSATTFSSGESHVFFTAPPAGRPHPTRIWVIGDAGTGTANQAAVRNTYYSFAQGAYTDLMLMLGDNAYDNGTDSEYTARHFNIYQDMLRQTVSWPTIGNHDTAGSSNPSSGIAYYQSFTLPKAGEAGGIPSGTEDYYSFDYGDIHFICLDSMTENRASTGTMATWLRQDLANTSQRWIIVYFHHPPYSKGHDSDTETNMVQMRTDIVPILEEYGVDLVLCGHSHGYERSYLLDGHYGHSSTLSSSMILDGSDGSAVGGYNKPTFEGAGREGAVYTVAGSSGKTQNYGLINDDGTGNGIGHPANFISWERLGSLIIDVDGHRMDVKFLRENGLVADAFSITRGPRTNAAPVAAMTSPANGAEFNRGAAVQINATASDSDQGIDELVVYANSSRIATLTADAQGTYSHQWTPPATGTYRIEVRAVDLLGNSSVAQAVDISVVNGVPAPDSIPPAAIANLNGVATTTSVTLSWRAPGDDGADSGTAAAYDIRYSTEDPALDGSAEKDAWWAAAVPALDEPVPLPAGSTQSFGIAGLGSNTTYYFAIKASDESANVSPISNIPAVTTLVEPPSGPTNLVGSIGANGQVHLSWTDTSADEDGFSMERSLDPFGGFAQIRLLGENVTSMTDDLVYAGSTYYYRVSATKMGAVSPTSNVLKITTPPPAPMNLVATPSSTQVALNWAPSSGALSYTVSRYNPAAAAFEVIASGLTATTHTDSGLASGTTYTYQVQAANAGGLGAPAEITTQTVAPQPPAAPSALAIASVSATEVQLGWVDNSGNEDGFTLERSANGVNFAAVATLDANTAAYTDAGLIAGTTYWFRVRAFNADGTSAYSNVASATTLEPPTAPEAPTALSAVAVSKSQVNLSWTDGSGNESAFVIERSTNGRSFSQIDTVAANVTSYSDTAVAGGKTYHYRVKAVNEAGESAYTGVAKATTPKK